MSTRPAAALLDPPLVEDMSAGDVLRAVAKSRALERAQAAQQLVLACAWADQHPALEPGDEASLVERGPDGGVHLPISGEGCPLVAEYSIAEFGAVLGESTVAAKRMIGQALELRHRLPRLWALVLDGRVPAWRARLVAAETIGAFLTIEAAAWVDSQVAAVAGKVGTAQVQQLVREAILRFGLEAKSDVDPDRRRADLGEDDPETGTIRFEATLSTADGLDLDHALAHGAAELKALGCTDDLDSRRSQALGHLARQQTALDLCAQEHGTTAADDSVKLPAARELVLNLHFDARLTGDELYVGPLGRLDKGQRLVLRDHVARWCGDTLTRISIRPVIDLNDELSAPGYDIPDRIRDHVIARDGSCMFPWCSRAARACDLDHVTPYDHDAETQGRPQPGPTTTSNLIPLCRRHHRLKTHTAWRVQMPTPGTVTWTSPHGHQFQRDRTGTTALGEQQAPRVPRPRPPERD
jgi:hypothetical protein